YRLTKTPRAKEPGKTTRYHRRSNCGAPRMGGLAVRPRLLDLFCGAGGAAMGYHRAGVEVVGVDIRPQPHYPFEFVQADAMTYPREGFEAIHPGPPCQAFSTVAKQARTRFPGRFQHPDLVDPTRDR